MKQILTTLLLTTICMLVSAQQQQATQSQQGIVFNDNTPWAEILKMAQEQEKLIFIDCYTIWCGPCKAMAREVFTLKEVGDYFNPNFICVKYDMEKGDGKMLNERYKDHIPGYPTLLIIDPQGAVKQQMAGYQEGETLIQSAKMALEGKDLFTLSKEYEAGNRDMAFLSDYMTSLEAAFKKDEAAQVADSYLKSHDASELDRDDVWNTFGKYVTDIRTPAFEHLVNNAGRYAGVMKRDRQAINFQIKAACDRELRQFLRINFDKQGNAEPLATDTAWAEKVIWYLEKTGQAGADQYRLYLYIHKQLLNGRNAEAWNAVKTGVRAHMSGFYAMKVGDYIAYLAPQTRDKKVLKDYAALMESYLDRGKNTDYAVYKTLADLNRRLGNKQLAEQQQATYEELLAKERKQFEELFKKSE